MRSWDSRVAIIQFLEVLQMILTEREQHWINEIKTTATA